MSWKLSYTCTYKITYWIDWIHWRKAIVDDIMINACQAHNFYNLWISNDDNAEKLFGENYRKRYNLCDKFCVLENPIKYNVMWNNDSADFRLPSQWFKTAFCIKILFLIMAFELLRFGSTKDHNNQNAKQNWPIVYHHMYQIFQATNIATIYDITFIKSFYFAA